MLVPLGSVFGPKDPDFRGRIEVDDVKQWCFPDETLAKLRSLRKTAASGDAKAGRAALDEANASLDFRPRSTPCPPEIGRTVDSGSKAKLARADPLQTFYPASSLFREEQGDIVLRTHVNAAGCATDVAIVVHSGYPQLDAAALKWFETGHFLPEYADGKAVDKELTFKVRFKLRDES